ncbi:glycosyltransferase family 4 protein [Mucilaginibacter lappiensis]|uniref:Glycosyltransferase involved in cell wall biosynthesis n=1 Tax=Mucilaginibacter lappiensis TaxID=354630 RepID=A0A841JKR2_9SPHI|nr:glycosyltransferase family 1 protein [Mucilaginibacter lappiensis]MBB6130862.1 glycosyltransferase involved in cell wall biosynthesis [Mucilaginibacter lappiensis]
MKPTILITFDSLKRATSGMFFFERSLGEEILKENKGRFAIFGYLHKKSIYWFQQLAGTILMSPLHKIFFPAYKQFDLVHFTNQYCKLKPARVKAKKVLTIHDMNPVHEKTRSPARYKKYLNRLGGYIDSCDRIVTISNFVAGDIVKYYPQAASKLTVIYNGADKLVLPQHHEPPYKPARKFIFTIGSLAPKKNFHVLPALLNDNELELIIAGKITDYQLRIMEEASKHNCTSRVKLIGLISDDDKAWYYKNCEAFAFPSIAEGFGLPVIEAMHFGKPVFLSRYTSLPEIGGDAAWYFDSFEPETMRATFAKGLEEYTSNNMEASITQHANQFNWEKTAQQYLDLYTDCLGI